MYINRQIDFYEFEERLIELYKENILELKDDLYFKGAHVLRDYSDAVIIGIFKDDTLIGYTVSTTSPIHYLSDTTKTFITFITFISKEFRSLPALRSLLSATEKFGVYRFECNYHTISVDSSVKWLSKLFNRLKYFESDISYTKKFIGE
jgi:hypothetical protein